MIVVMAVIKCDRRRRRRRARHKHVSEEEEEEVEDGIQPGEDIEQDGEATAMQRSEFDGSPNLRYLYPALNSVLNSSNTTQRSPGAAGRRLSSPNQDDGFGQARERIDISPQVTPPAAANASFSSRRPPRGRENRPVLLTDINRFSKAASLLPSLLLLRFIASLSQLQPGTGGSGGQ